VVCRDRPRCVPIVTGLCRGPGHAGKIALAKALLRAVGDCGSAWNKDPAFGVIGIQSGPRG
jgi:hypothetical protein